MLRIFRDKKGAMAPLVALSMTALLGVASLSVDVGVLYHNKSQLTNMADAAALAGARQLPDNTTAARTAADRIANLNGLQASDQWSGVVSYTAVSDDTFTTTVSRDVGMFFARVLGINQTTVSATAAAQVWPVAGITGVVPFGIPQTDFQPGGEYTLKAGKGSTGNFGALALGPPGADSYAENIRNGYSGRLEISSDPNVPLLVDEEPGDIAGKTKAEVDTRINADNTDFAHVKPNSPRIVMVPIIDALGQGRATVEVVGFAAFFLEKTWQGDEGIGTGNDSYVKGRFMNYVHPTATGGHQAGDFGLRTVRLIK